VVLRSRVFDSLCRFNTVHDWGFRRADDGHGVGRRLRQRGQTPRLSGHGLARRSRVRGVTNRGVLDRPRPLLPLPKAHGSDNRADAHDSANRQPLRPSGAACICLVGFLRRRESPGWRRCRRHDNGGRARRRSYGRSWFDHGSRSGRNGRPRRLRRRLLRRGRHGCGSRSGRNRCGGGRRRDDGYPLARREEAQRVEVPVFVVRPPDAEVHVRGVRDRVRALADAPDAHALCNRVAPPDRDARELKHGYREAVAGLDRQRAAAVRHRPRERNGAADRCVHGFTNGCADVDAAVLPAGVRIAPEGERAEHRPVDRPRPRGRGSRNRERKECEDDQ
jgi:hypothetical protein